MSYLSDFIRFGQASVGRSLGSISRLWRRSLGSIPRLCVGLANGSAVRKLSVFMKFYHYYRGVVAARLASGIGVVVLAALLGQAAVAAKPNIVFVLADDMGFGDVPRRSPASYITALCRTLVSTHPARCPREPCGSLQTSAQLLARCPFPETALRAYPSAASTGTGSTPGTWLSSRRPF